MRPTFRESVAVGISVIALSGAPAGVTPAALTIDPANSRVEIHVGREGLFGFAGHEHEVLAPSVNGRVEVDPGDWQRTRVSLEFDAATLRITGRNEPAADLPEVQRVMFSERVLDVARFPKIVFQSRRVSVASRNGGSGLVDIEGDLALHGTMRPTTIRAEVTLQPAGDLEARGSFRLKQTQFGMVPVTAAGGTVRVKDELDIRFVLKARPASGTTTAS